MDFREEYKKSAEVMTPSAEAMERMTKNIMEQVNAPVKKAIPFRKISYIGGAVAACAVIAVGAVKLLPSMQTDLATADAALTDSAAAVYQESAPADEEGFMPVNGVQAEADSDNTKLEYAIGDSNIAMSDNDAAYDFAADAAEDTAAMIEPALSENEDTVMSSDKTFADGAPTAAVDNAAPEKEAMDEAEAVIESFTDECGTIFETVPDCPAELIYVADDMQSFTIGGTEYIRLPKEYVTNESTEENSIAYYIGSDGKQYEVTYFGDIVRLASGEFSDFYCTADMYEQIIMPQS